MLSSLTKVSSVGCTSLLFPCLPFETFPRYFTMFRGPTFVICSIHYYTFSSKDHHGFQCPKHHILQFALQLCQQMHIRQQKPLVPEQIELDAQEPPLAKYLNRLHCSPIPATGIHCSRCTGFSGHKLPSRSIRCCTLFIHSLQPPDTIANTS